MASNITKINYNECRKIYLDKVKTCDKLQGLLCTREGIEKTIKQIINYETKFYNMTVQTINGKHKLYLKTKKEASYLEVVLPEDAFDILLEKHIECHHGNADNTDQLVRREYSVPTVCVHLFVESCNVCHPRNGDHNQKWNKKKGLWRMNIIPMGSPKSTVYDRYCYLLIYKEDRTNFVILRPLFISTNELCMELLKLCLEFGFPGKIVVPNKLQLYRDVFDSLHTLRSDSEKVVVEQIKSNIFEKDQVEVVKELENWKRQNKNIHWEIGCHIVQFKMNTTQKYITTIADKEQVLGIPFHLFFGPEANVKNFINVDI